MKTSVLDRTRVLLRGAFTQNLRLKALAMGITILIFVLVRGGSEVGSRLAVEVDVIRPGTDSEHILITDVPETVTLRVRGTPSIVHNLDADEIPPVTLDLSEEEDGVYTIDPALFRVPPGIEVQSVRPASFRLHYELRARIAVSVVPTILGHVAEEHHIKEPIIIEPTKVRLSGSRSVLNELTEIRTHAVNVGGLGSGQHRRRVLLEQPPEGAVYSAAGQVTVIVVVEPDIIERVFTNVVVEALGTELDASSETVSVTVRGRPELVERVLSANVGAFVELGDEGATAGTYRRQVQITGLQDELTVEVTPVTVIVIVVEPTLDTDDDLIEAPPEPLADPRALFPNPPLR